MVFGATTKLLVLLRETEGRHKLILAMIPPMTLETAIKLISRYLLALPRSKVVVVAVMIRPGLLQNKLTTISIDDFARVHANERPVRLDRKIGGRSTFVGIDKVLERAKRLDVRDGDVDYDEAVNVGHRTVIRMTGVPKVADLGKPRSRTVLDEPRTGRIIGPTSPTSRLNGGRPRNRRLQLVHDNDGVIPVARTNSDHRVGRVRDRTLGDFGRDRPEVVRADIGAKETAEPALHVLNGVHVVAIGTQAMVKVAHNPRDKGVGIENDELGRTSTRQLTATDPRPLKARWF